MKSDLIIGTKDGSAKASLFVPTEPTTEKLPGILFYMDALGPREAMFVMAQRIADAGYIVLLPDLFYRFGTYGPFDGGSFRDEAKLAQIMKMLGETTLEMTARDTVAFVNALEREGVEGKIGTVGYCMGGARALNAAAAFPNKVKAAASFHGGNLANDAENSPHRQAGKMKARVYVGTAGVDSSFPPEQSARLAEALRVAEVDYTLENYVGMNHGWTVPDRNEIYNEAGSERHWRRLLTLFGESLKD